jgi:putative ABC transport system permease protein
LYAPMSGDSWNTSVRVAGKPEPPAKENTGAGWTRVTPGFFDVLGNRMVMGRAITDEDTATTRSVAVINEAFAKKFFKGENPIGKHFGPGETKYSGMYEVVGVADDMRYITYDLKEPAKPMFFLPESQSAHYTSPTENAGELWSHYLYNLVLWAPGNPPGLEAQVRKALGEIDPNLVLYTVDSYGHLLGADFAQQNMIATLTLLFGALGLVLAAVGLYGVTAYTVEQRTSEIGVRMALGANRGNVVSMVLRDAFWQVGVGLAVGIPAAIGAGWAITTQLFGVKFWDPAMLSVAAVMLAMAALAAALIPAQRAASLDPMRALRME